MLDAAFCRISGLRFIESTVETLAFKGAALAKAQVVYASRIHSGPVDLREKEKIGEIRMS